LFFFFFFQVEDGIRDLLWSRGLGDVCNRQVQMSPAWFIPIVGNIIAPLGAVHFLNLEIAWFFFSIGLFFWIILQAILMYRLFFHPPMMQALEPTLFILIAPPAMGFASYVTLNGVVDDFARILYYIALFYTLLLLLQTPRFLKVPFSVSWWAYTFPLAAVSGASFTIYEFLSFNSFLIIASVLLVLLTIIILYNTVQTIIAIKNNRICIPLPDPKNTIQTAQSD